MYKEYAMLDENEFVSLNNYVCEVKLKISHSYIWKYKNKNL